LYERVRHNTPRCPALADRAVFLNAKCHGSDLVGSLPLCATAARAWCSTGSACDKQSAPLVCAASSRRTPSPWTTDPSPPSTFGLGKITGGIARDALTQGLRVHGLDKASVPLLMARAQQTFQTISPTTLPYGLQPPGRPSTARSPGAGRLADEHARRTVGAAIRLTFC